MKAIMAFAVVASALAAPASAITIMGSTTGKPTWNRPVAGNPPTGPLSGVGTAVSYDVTAFTVDAGGSYAFQSTALYDNYLFLYQGSFNPASQFTNVLIGNDDNPSIGLSGFSYNLLTGTSYFAVATAFNNGDTGAYSLSINGPGNVIPSNAGPAVPEPATWALMISGFGLVGATMRRRRMVSLTA